ncbi:MAG TPA: ATP-binding protein [Gaiellaceae bacterium]|nr:ATP-binding protein [Gaiellaceae bacterium]
MSTDRRHRLEASIPPLASSIDGRRFTFQCSLHGLELQAGGYVELGGVRLGQVHTLEHAWVDAGTIDGDDATGMTGIRVGIGQGEGVVLDGEPTPFHDDELRPATGAEVADWLERARPDRATLDVGELALVPSVRHRLDAGGFDRHTFFCGQSGSGKSYALGTVLERLLLESTIRVVVLDPNSDFVRVAEPREGIDADVAARYAKAAEGVEVRSAGERGADRLHVRFTDLDPAEQAAVLRLDPIRDRDEYSALVEAVEHSSAMPEGATGVKNALATSEDSRLRALGTRIGNLGIDRWRIWSVGDPDSLQELVAPGGPRCLVVDIGSLTSPEEQAVAAESVLGTLWRRRTERVPTLVVVDEAHNVCPREPDDEVRALATEHAVRFAAEGRKFGLYLLVSTQRPQRVHDLVVSQCDNLVLMRMNAPSDLAYIAETLSFAPRPLLERSLSFGLGESLVAGKISSHPAIVRFGPRLAREGGTDVPTTWAARTDA